MTRRKLRKSKRKSTNKSTSTGRKDANLLSISTLSDSGSLLNFNGKLSKTRRKRLSKSRKRRRLKIIKLKSFKKCMISTGDLLAM